MLTSGHTQATVPFDPIIHTHESNVELFRCLSNECGKRPRLPAELIFQILALPSRWVFRSRKSLSAPTNIGSREGERIIVKTESFNKKDITLVRKIILDFTSKDQGWSSHPMDRGSYRGSWTWMDVGIVHDGQKRLKADDADGELQECGYASQRNRHASPEWESYRIELEAGHQIFKDLQDGDSVVLWAKARFPGWTNYVKEATVETWYEDDLEGLEL